MEPVQEEGDVSEVFLSLGPPEEALEHRPRVPRERRTLGLGQPEVEAREREPEVLAHQLRGRVALGTQREGRDVKRLRGRGGLPLQGLESVRDPRPETVDRSAPFASLNCAGPQAPSARPGSASVPGHCLTYK